MADESSVPSSLRQRLIATALAAGGIGTGVGTGVGYTVADAPIIAAPSAEVLLAMEIGSYYEGVRYVPYRDQAGGGVWTVCRGLTGPDVDAAAKAGRRYSEAECKQLELRHYMRIEREAKGIYRHWDSYNIWVRASMLDMLYNLGRPQLATSTHVRLANAGDLTGACQQMLRWVWGRDAATGRKVQWQGLKDRRATTQEICDQWGRDGHFSVAYVQEPQP